MRDDATHFIDYEDKLVARYIAHVNGWELKRMERVRASLLLVGARSRLFPRGVSFLCGILAVLFSLVVFLTLPRFLSDSWKVKGQG